VPIELIDIGSNLTHDSFDHDREAVISDAASVGVTRQVVTGADLASSIAAAALAAGYRARLWSTAGVHPHHAAAWNASQRAALVELLQRPQVVAIGECGLDYYRNFSPPPAQRAAFAAQLEIAAELGKPVFLHQRDSHRDFTAILDDFRGRLAGGVAHCFTGTRAQLEDYLALGLSIGVTGWVCDERRGADLRDAVPYISEERLMVETDSPYLLPRDLDPKPKSRRNEPKHLVHVARAVARLRNEPWEKLAAATTRNAVRFFGLAAADDERPRDS
jgi:TatD DNase family protein